MEYIAKNEQNALTYFYLCNTLHVNEIMCLFCVEMTFIILIVCSKQFNDFDYIIDWDVYKQTHCYLLSSRQIR